MYLLSRKGMRCATLEELASAIANSGVVRSKDPRGLARKTLARMAMRGLIERGWVKIGDKQKRKLYCLKEIEVGSE